MVGAASTLFSTTSSGAQNTGERSLQAVWKTTAKISPDHIHLLIDASPQFNIPDMIRIMKGVTARKLFLLYPEMKEKLWGGHLWNPSYCVVTVSDRSLAQVEEYIESQKEKEWGGRGRRPRDIERLQAYHREIANAGDIKLQSGDPEAEETS